MKKLLLLSALLTFCFTSYAEIFVIVDKKTNEIYTVAGKNDTAIPKGKELHTLPGDISNYEFIENPCNMKLLEGKFIVNTEKINKEYQDKIKREKKDKEEKLITERMRKIAREQLIEEKIIEGE